MSVITEISEVLRIKDEAITDAVAHLKKFRSDDCQEGCDLESLKSDTPSQHYHWRGCPKTIDPIIKRLLDAIKVR